VLHKKHSFGLRTASQVWLIFQYLQCVKLALLDQLARGASRLASAPRARKTGRETAFLHRLVDSLPLRFPARIPTLFGWSARPRGIAVIDREWNAWRPVDMLISPEPHTLF
jgi:hypothetical protein